MSPARLVLLVLFTAVPAAALQTPAPEDVSIDRPLTLSIAKGAIFELRGGVGNITVTRSPGTDTIVTATRAPGGTGAEPRVQLVRHEKGVTVCSMYDSGNPKKPNECRPMGKGRRFEGLKKDSPALHYDVQLPDGVTLFVDSAQGDITTRALTGRLDLSVWRGNIFLTDGGSPDIRTNVTAGETDATVGAFETGGVRHLSFNAAGGKLRVRIPPNVPIDYWITSGMPIDTPFKLHRTAGEVSSGHLGPPGSDISLRIDAGSLLARISLLPANAPRR